MEKGVWGYNCTPCTFLGPPMLIFVLVFRITIQSISLMKTRIIDALFIINSFFLGRENGKRENESETQFRARPLILYGSFVIREILGTEL